MNSPPNSADPLLSMMSPEELLAATAEEAKAHSRELTKTQSRHQQALREQALADRLGRAGMPLRYRDFDFSTFPVERLARPADAERARMVRGTCERYVDTWPAVARRGTNVILVGPMGTGKTGLACAIANAVIRHHPPATALFISAYGAVRHQRDTWRKRGKSETEALDDLVCPDLLVMDEVGVQVGTESEMLMLFEVLNGRYGQRKPTILLSNLPVQREDGPSLRRFLGERLWSRYTDDASFVLACDWPNLRGREVLA